MAGFDNDVMFASNVDFRGVEPVVGQVTANGQLLIGSTVSPNIRVSTLTAGTGITITNGAGSITVATDGATVGQTITGNTGGALFPTAGNWNILGTSTNGIQSAGSGSTLTVRMQSPYADGDFDFQSTVSGQTRTLTIENTSNTASSAATQLIKVAGTSAANPYTQWAVGTTRVWALGIENASSQRLTLSMDAAGTVSPGGGNYIYSATAGATSFLSSFTFWIPTVAIGGLTNPGAPVNLNIQNSSTTALSDAVLSLNTSTTTGGMPYISYGSLGNNWWHGVDKTGSTNTFRIQYGNTGIFPGLTNIVTMTVLGNINHPLNSSFNALSGDHTNVTGDGTAYTVIFGTVSYDQNSNYNNTTGIFTAPVAGRYHFSTGVTFSNIGAAHTSGTFQIQTTGGNFLGGFVNPTAVAAGGVYTFNMSCYANMSAGDTAKVVLTVSGSTKTINVNGVGSQTYFGGRLVD